MFDREDLREYAALYLSGVTPTSPDCSPLLAEVDALRAVGPVMLEYADDELLRGDALAFAEACQLADVQLTVAVEPVAPHGWQLFPDLLPEAKRSIVRMHDFLSQP